MKKFALEESCDTVAMPRYFFAFKDRRAPHQTKKGARSRQGKLQVLATLQSMVMARVLPAYGMKRTALRQVTQKKLAAMAGLGSRSSYTRRVSSIASDNRSTATSADRLPALIHRRRNFAAPNNYDLALPSAVCSQGCVDPAHCSHERAAGAWFPPKLKELQRTAAHIAALFTDTDEEYSGAGYGETPAFVWDERVPVSDTARVVLTYYGSLKLFEKGKIEKCRQSLVARRCGISTRQVRRANAEWAAIGVLRIAHPTPEIRDGRLVRGPQIVIYVPGRQWSREDSTRELARMQHKAEGARSDGNALWIEKALLLSQELTRAWEGTERGRMAYWRELRTRLAGAGLNPFLIDRLVPKPPP